MENRTLGFLLLLTIFLMSILESLVVFAFSNFPSALAFLTKFVGPFSNAVIVLSVMGAALMFGTE